LFRNFEYHFALFVNNENYNWVETRSDRLLSRHQRAALHIRYQKRCSSASYRFGACESKERSEPSALGAECATVWFSFNSLGANSLFYDIYRKEFEFNKHKAIVSIPDGRQHAIDVIDRKNFELVANKLDCAEETITKLKTQLSAARSKCQKCHRIAKLLKEVAVELDYCADDLIK
jgi:hypothetical protein